MEKLFAGLTELLKHATAVKVIAVSFLLIATTVVYTLFENRQQVYDAFAFSKITGDYYLKEPSPAGLQLMQDLANKYPNIQMISLIDADPVQNTRRLVARAYSSPELRKIMEDTDRIDPTAGSGPLFTSDADNNQQMLAIMSGEFLCTKSSGLLIRNFQGSDQHVAYQCRVPLPPAFNKATGWFTLQLKTWPDERIEQMKFDALNMSLAYYYEEIEDRPKRLARPE